MKKIICVDNAYLYDLRNAALLTLMQRAHAEVAALEDSTQAGIPAADLASWKECIDQMQTVVNANRASEATDPRADEHARRNSYWFGMKAGVEAGKRSPDAAEAAAANTLDYVFNPFRNMADAPMNDETAQIDGLLKVLEDYSAELETLGLTKTAEALKESNEAFVGLTQSRMKDRVASRPAETKLIRASLYAHWEWICACLDATYVVGETSKADKAEGLIALFNQIIRETAGASSGGDGGESDRPVIPDEGEDGGGEDDRPAVPDEGDGEDEPEPGKDENGDDLPPIE